MAITKDTLVDALRLRYDSYSAETVFELACMRAGLEGKTSLETKEVAAFRAALEKVGDRVGNVLARIDDLAGTSPAKPEPKHESKPAEASDGKPESKAEAKADSKPNEAKSDGKPETKPAGDSKPNEAKADSKPNEAKSDGKPEAKHDSKPNEAKADSKPNEAKAESKSSKTDEKHS